MKVKAYPLIYSRILNDDYPNGFLARPEDLDVSVATKYVIPAMENIQHVGGIRHTVFPVGEYLIYGGVACVAGKLVERILQNKHIDFPYEEYQADKAGRPLIFFIGFALRKSELIRNEIPDIDLYSTYRIYLSYLEKQWHNQNATTDFSKEIELNTHLCNFSEPQHIRVGEKHILSNYREDDFQQTIDYYFAGMAWRQGGDFSFLSNVLSDDAVRSPFANISPYNCTPEECSYIMRAVNTSAAHTQCTTRNETEIRTNHTVDRPIASVYDSNHNNRFGTRESGKKKSKNSSTNLSNTGRTSTRKSLPVVMVILAAAAIILLLMYMMTQKL